ncbi:MAG: P-type DNA transfer ATPase VirB11, partial [Salinisphaera sp.]|nr:P-type DNA transfer ATPase VirB11 [Salinisphaera sp.]
VNNPGELWLDAEAGRRRVALPWLTLERLRTLAELVGQSNKQAVDAAAPILSARLPTKERVQITIPGACEDGHIYFAIRKPADKVVTLEEYQAAGVFEQTERVAVDLPRRVQAQPSTQDRQLAALADGGDWMNFIRQAVLAKKNILVSGTTGCGKTTFLNALLREVPEHERIGTIEDVRELQVKQPNRFHLLVRQPHPTAAHQLKNCLRMNPDRIIMGEIRGEEADDYLDGLNTGHPGSICSVHANSAADVFDRLVDMAMGKGSTRSPENILAKAGKAVQVAIQITKDAGPRRVSGVYFGT